MLIADQGDLLGLALVYAYVAVVVLISAYAKRRYPRCSYRKIIHILVGNIVFLWWVFDSNYVMAFLAAAPFIVLLLLVTPYSPIKALKSSFLCDATSQGHFLGLVYYAVSWTMLALFLFDDRMVAAIAIVAMSYGDGLGGLVGKRFGRRTIWGRKTLEGTSAVFATTIMATLVVIGFYGLLAGSYPLLNVTLLTPSVAVVIAVMVGAVVAVVELFSPGEYDNLFVPFSAAALLLIMGL